ncbi:MAG: hypothetical protein K0R66_399 [Gammaproteobacteria bacterium]|jgi:ankyrin repeat protein/energy-coupling factor transporter ATP-binding protein EcfA2|nr:hypothetical protein [Gammaproteobacteria bacterium]
MAYSPPVFLSSPVAARQGTVLASSLIEIGQVSVRDISAGLIEALARIAVIQDKTIVPVIGNTGSGKSTLVNVLMGHRFEEIETDEGESVLRVVTPGKSAQMGTNIEACTIYPEAFLEPESGYYFCDCPGFLDTRGKKERILIEMCLKMLPKKARDIKGLVIVIEHDMLYTQKASGFKRLIENLQTVLPDLTIKTPDELRALQRSLVFVFNAKGKTKTLKNIAARSADLIQAESQALQALVARKAAGEKSAELLSAIYELQFKLALMQFFNESIEQERFILFNPDDTNQTKRNIMSVLSRGMSFPKAEWGTYISSPEYKAFSEQLLGLRLDSKLHLLSAEHKEAIDVFLLAVYGKLTYDETLSKSLHSQVRADNLDETKLLLANPFVNVNQKDALGKTALHVAADCLNLEAFKLLWRQPRTDCTVVDSDGKTFLHIALSNGPGYKTAQLIELLRLAVVENKIDFDRMDKSGRTALMLAREKGHGSEVISLLKTKARIDYDESASMTLLDKAKAQNSSEISALISRITVNVNQKGYRGRTALLIAADFLDIESFKSLWANSRVDKTAVDEDGRGVLHLALNNNLGYRPQQLLETLKVILRNNTINVDARDLSGRTALMLAREKGHSQEIISLLKTKATLDYDEALSKTLLEKARAQNVREIRAVIDNSLVNLNQKGYRDRTALLIAADFLDIETFKLLWAHPRVNLAAVDNSGGTVLHIALNNLPTYKSSELLQLVRLVLRDNKINVDAKDSSGKTALMIARDKGYSQEVITLLKTKARLDYDESLSKTMHEEVRTQNLARIRALICNLAVNLNQIDALGRTPLLTAAYWVCFDAFQLLWTNSKVNVSAVDSNSRTVLHLLLDNPANYRTSDLLGILRLVLSDSRVNVDAKDNSGKSALMIAREKNHSHEVIALLKTKAKIDNAFVIAPEPAVVVNNPLASARAQAYSPAPVYQRPPPDDDDCCCVVM